MLAVVRTRTTDLHALPVMIYLYLLYRHPLKGGKVNSLDTEPTVWHPENHRRLMVYHNQYLKPANTARRYAPADP